jgi:IclR family pca regulon transcriptional regulator
MDEKPTPPKPRAAEAMAGLAKGLAIIEAFADQRRELTVARAAQATSLSRASARRCLLTLAELGYVRQTGSAYIPTPRMLRLGSAFYEATSLPLLAQPHLDGARDELNEPVSLAVLENDQAVFVARAEVSRPVTAFVRLGTKLPAFAAATGRVLLANLPEESIRAYLARTQLEPLSPKTVTDPEKLLDLIEEVRKNGYAIICEELELGMLAMAVPVRDASGQTRAALSISASMARISPERLQQDILPTMLRRAEALSRML